LNDNSAESLETAMLIHPYQEKLEKEMNEVLIISSEEFPKERGKAQTKLGNLVADLSLEIANQLYKPIDNHFISFCLLNFGGLRTSLPEGEITRGKIFELMPFENELVVVTITQEKCNELTTYIKDIGGQPISGSLTLHYKENYVDEELLSVGRSFDNKKTNGYKNNTIKILTSDYLANGGDKMNFFLNPIRIEPVGIKLRDAIIQYCISENEKGNQLVGKLDGRITFE
jgi:2',3'-cyclic-nucleotide 2'-phosphodiesterase (5'-nucleotidase family)